MANPSPRAKPDDGTRTALSAETDRVAHHPLHLDASVLIRSTAVNPMCMRFQEFNRSTPTRGRNGVTELPSTHAVQTDPKTSPLKGPKTSRRKGLKINPRTRPRIDPKIEERSGIDTDPKDWTLGRINRSRSIPKFDLTEWCERTRTDDHPKQETIRERQPSEDGCCSETATCRGQWMPVHEGKPSCPNIPVYRCRCEWYSIRDGLSDRPEPVRCIHVRKSERSKPTRGR
jgi:hypothetical protein